MEATNFTQQLLINNSSGSISSAPVIKYYAYGVVLPVVCLSGIIGNILNILTLRSPLLEAVSYRYLRSLAFADLICMAFVLIFVSKELKSNSIRDFPLVWYWADLEFAYYWYVAHLELPLINLFITAGVLVVIGLTLDRYICIVFPTHFRSWNTSKHATLAISAAYLISLCLYVPMCWEKTVLLQANGNGYKVGSNHRVVHSTWYIVYKWTRECIVKVLPVLLLGYFTVHMIVEFRHVQKRRSNLLKLTKANLSEMGSSRGRDERRLTVLLAGIALMFFVCSTPAAINLILINQSLSSSVPYQIFRATANILEITNHAVNFYVFCFCSSDYRTEFLKTFPFMRKLTGLKTKKVSSTLSRASQQTCLPPTAFGSEKRPDPQEIRSLINTPKRLFTAQQHCDHVYHHFITLSRSGDEEIVMLHNDSYDV